jgi:hypothetical protein
VAATLRPGYRPRHRHSCRSFHADVVCAAVLLRATGVQRRVKRTGLLVFQQPARHNCRQVQSRRSGRFLRHGRDAPASCARTALRGAHPPAHMRRGPGLARRLESVPGLRDSLRAIAEERRLAAPVTSLTVWTSSTARAAVGLRSVTRTALDDRAMAFLLGPRHRPCRDCAAVRRTSAMAPACLASS